MEQTRNNSSIHTRDEIIVNQDESVKKKWVEPSLEVGEIKDLEGKLNVFGKVL